MSSRRIWNGSQWVEIGAAGVNDVIPITQADYDLEFRFYLIPV
jgi:hypothetical protein